MKSVENNGAEICYKKHKQFTGLLSMLIITQL